jgi:hypothetical protein
MLAPLPKSADLEQVPPPPRRPTRRAARLLVHLHRGRLVVLALMPGLVTAVFAAWNAPIVMEDLRLDFGPVERVRGQITAVRRQVTDKGKVYAACADFVDLEQRGLAGTTCNLPAAQVTGPAALDVRGRWARVSGGRNVERHLVGLVLFLLLIYSFVGAVLAFEAARRGRALREGSVALAREGSTPPFEAGAQVVVLYDPKRPTITTLWLGENG